MFAAADIVDFCHLAGWSLRVRSKDRDGKPYQSWGKRASDVPAVPMSKVPKVAPPSSAVVASVIAAHMPAAPWAPPVAGSPVWRPLRGPTTGVSPLTGLT